VTVLYGIDFLVGLFTTQGFLDLSMFTKPWSAPDFGFTNILVNLPQIVAVMIFVLVRARRSDANVPAKASV